MRVLINLLVASGKKTGVGHYASELVRCLQQQMGDDRLDVFPRPWVRRAWALGSQMRPYLERKKQRAVFPAADAAAPPSLRSRALGGVRQLGQALLASHLKGYATRERCDLYHEPNSIPLASDLPTVVTLPDLSVLLHPEWHPADRVAHFERHFRQALPRCAHFLAISEFCRQEVIQTFNLPPGRVTRTYMGVRPGLRPMSAAEVAPVLRQLGLPPTYLLYLGTIEPRKNLLFLLRTYCALPERLRDRCPLLLAGGWGWNTSAVADYLQDEARHRGVLHLGYVAEENLAALYNGARALVYPSLYEGFGLPPIEMMACGGAVLASTAGAVVETVGRRAHLLAPDDADGWREALGRVITDDDWLQSLRRDVTEVARGFTWEQCAADTLRVYRAVSEPSAGGGASRAA